MPRQDLLKLLEGVGGGIGMDSSVIQSKKYPEFYQVSTTDFFYPLVEDPEDMGRIACANVLSDIYAFGLCHVDNLLMLLAASTDMSPQESSIVCHHMIKGFDDHCKLAGTVVSGGQTVKNPWPLIGGVAQSLCKQSDFIMPVGARPGNIVVLTKPLGTQVCVNFKQWMHSKEKFETVQKRFRDNFTQFLAKYSEHPTKKQKLDDDEKKTSTSSSDLSASMLLELESFKLYAQRLQSMSSAEQASDGENTEFLVPREEVIRAFNLGSQSMKRLNLNAASLIHKYGALACTDVTGFGLLGHSDNLMRNQQHENRLMIEFHTLPVIRSMLFVNEFHDNFKLREGYASETSGGLLICFESLEKAQAYVDELRTLKYKTSTSATEEENEMAWIVGEVKEMPGPKPATAAEDMAQVRAKIRDDCRWIEI